MQIKKTIQVMLCLALCLTMVLGNFNIAYATELASNDDEMVQDTSQEQVMNRNTRATLIEKGYCTSTISWAYYSNGHFKLTGKGAMSDWKYYNFYRDWYNHLDSMTKITIGEGITTVGYSAFSGATKLKTINLPKSMKNVKPYAFGTVNRLQTVTLKGNAPKVGKNAFGTNSLIVKAPRGASGYKGAPWNRHKIVRYGKGWETKNGKTYYYNSKNQKLTGWRTIGGKRFYFKTSGNAKTKASMLTGWQKLSGKKYYFKTAGKNGVKGAALTGWHKLGGKKYYFDKNGVLKKTKK